MNTVGTIAEWRAAVSAAVAGRPARRRSQSGETPDCCGRDARSPMKTVGTIALVAFMGVAVSAQENLPPGEGQTLVLEACVQCHDLRAVVSQQKSEAAWRRTVDEMVWRGAPLMPGEAEVVTKYLATFGRGGLRPPARPNGRAQAAPTLPPGCGRELVLAACVECHDLEITVSQRKTREGWQRSVEQMARLGAKLNGSEVQVVTNYLARAFGPQRKPSS